MQTRMLRLQVPRRSSTASCQETHQAPGNRNMYTVAMLLSKIRQLGLAMGARSACWGFDWKGTLGPRSCNSKLCSVHFQQRAYAPLLKCSILILEQSLTRPYRPLDDLTMHQAVCMACSRSFWLFRIIFCMCAKCNFPPLLQGGGSKTVSSTRKATSGLPISLKQGFKSCFTSACKICGHRWSAAQMPRSTCSCMPSLLALNRRQ